MDMRAVDVLTNIKNWPAYDYKAYKLDEHESKPCINALENYIWHNHLKEGLPKENGFYLFKIRSKDWSTSSNSFYGYTAMYYIVNNTYISEDIIAWRKIVDEEDAYYE